jgi:RNA polymerase-binding protein DksA
MAQPQLDLAHFRQLLEDLRVSVQHEIESRAEEALNANQTEGYGVKNHPAEDATELYDRERSLALEAGMQRELDQIEHALERMAEGTYGICEVGGEPIPVERLEARPAATLCIQHQRTQDEQQLTNV